MSGKWTQIVAGTLFVGMAGALGRQYLVKKSSPVALLSDPRRECWVTIEGSVKNPGSYKIEPGSTLTEALAQAGGAQKSADLSSIDTSQVLTSGTIIHLASIADPNDQSRIVPPAPVTQKKEYSKKQEVTLGSVSLNTASSEELQAVKGIGPALAGRIIAYRQAHGGFRSIEELDQVKGIGAKTLAKLRPYFKL